MSDQDCVICTDPLHDGQRKIGACAPCGHVYHVDCFREWESKSVRKRANDGYSGRNVDYRAKCCHCNVPCDAFVNLFLDLSGKRHDDGEDDDGTVSSVETSDGENDDDNEESVMQEEEGINAVVAGVPSPSAVAAAAVAASMSSSSSAAASTRAEADDPTRLGAGVSNDLGGGLLRWNLAITHRGSSIANEDETRTFSREYLLAILDEFEEMLTRCCDEDLMSDFSGGSNEPDVVVVRNKLGPLRNFLEEAQRIVVGEQVLLDQSKTIEMLYDLWQLKTGLFDYLEDECREEVDMDDWSCVWLNVEDFADRMNRLFSDGRGFQTRSPSDFACRLEWINGEGDARIRRLEEELSSTAAEARRRGDNNSKVPRHNSRVVISIDLNDDDDSPNANAGSDESATKEISKSHRQAAKGEQKKEQARKRPADQGSNYGVEAKYNKLKKRYKRLKRDTKSRHEMHLRVLSSHSDKERRFEEMERKCQVMTANDQDMRLNMQSTSLRAERAERKYNELQAELLERERSNQRLKNERAEVLKELERAKKTYKDELAKANSESLSEVKKIIEERPRLIQEAHSLKRLVGKKDYEINQLRKQVRSFQEQIESRVDEELKQLPVLAMSNAAKIAKSFRKVQAEGQRHADQSAGRNDSGGRKKRTDPAPAATKMSAHSARFSRATNKRLRIDALNRASQTFHKHQSHRMPNQSQRDSETCSRSVGNGFDACGDSDDERRMAAPVLPVLMASSHSKRRRFAHPDQDGPLSTKGDGSSSALPTDERSEFLSKSMSSQPRPRKALALVGDMNSARSTSSRPSRSTAEANFGRKKNDIRTLFRKHG